MNLEKLPNPRMIEKTGHKFSAGFTLMELLLVVALFALLALILLPTIGGVLQRGKSAQCLANLRGIGIALGSYIYDSDVSPRKRSQEIYSFLGGSVPGEDTWSNLLVARGYIQDKKTLRCPSVVPATPITAANWFYETYGLNMVTQPGVSIGENFSLGGFSGGIYRLPLSRVVSPARLIIVADSRAEALSANKHEVQRFRLLAGRGADAISLRHHGKANILFLDSHIEALSGNEIENLRGNPYAGVPYYDEVGAYHP